MPHLPVKIFSKVNNAIGIIQGSSSIFNNSINFNISGDHIRENRQCFADSTIILSMEVTGFTAPFTGLTAIQNGCSWVRSYTINMVDKEGNIYSESSMNEIGAVGGIMLLICSSYNQVAMSNELYFATPPQIDTPKFQLSLNCRFIFDMFMSKRYIDMQSMVVNINFQPASYLFDLSGVKSEWTIKCNKAMLSFDTYGVDLMQSDQYYLKVSGTRRYTQQYNISSGQQTISIQLSPPGKIEWLMYYFGDIPSSGSTPNVYNSWNYSLPSMHQLQNVSSSGGFPLNSAFEVDIDTTSTSYDPYYGAHRFYRDFLSVIDKISPEKNSFLTFEQWKTKYRLYAIECMNDIMSYGTYSLQIQMNKASVGVQQLTLFCAYTPRDQPTEVGQLIGSSIF